MRSANEHNRLLCLSYRFPPESYPVATRVEYILNNMENWQIDAVTAAESPEIDDHVTPYYVPPRTPEQLFSKMRDLYLGKVLEWFVWPDPFLFWVLPAYRKARQLAETYSYDALLVFMMPYSPGLAGVLLKKQLGIPLILNFDDSLTCSDLHPKRPSRLHYWMSRKLEDLYVRTADTSVYVSKRNMQRVRDRQPAPHRSKFQLVRWGSQSFPPSEPPTSCEDDDFRIVYAGGTSGWYEFLERERSSSLPKKAYQTWEEAGRYEMVDLDHRTHGPVFVGRAVKRLVEQHPNWAGRIHVDVYGKRYPESVENAVLDKFNLQDIVHLHDPVSHDEALRHMSEADLLFMALPNRLDGSPGGRISAKTYEYLRTDRPILGALPPGENREYLRDKPGVHLTPPDGIEDMADVMEHLATDSFNGRSIAVDRSELHPALSSTARAQKFEQIVAETAHKSSAQLASSPPPSAD